MSDAKAINRTGVIFLLACVCCFLWGSASPSIKTGYSLFSIAIDKSNIFSNFQRNDKYRGKAV